MVTPLYIATRRFDPSDGERWQGYCRFASIPGLVEVVSLDTLLCPHLAEDIIDEDWQHMSAEDPRLGYFVDVDYLLQRVRNTQRRNILGLYRNARAHITVPPGSGGFVFVGYDLIEDLTQISALTNCGGFPDVFANDELNPFGLMDDFERACEIRRLLARLHPEESHAQCEMYAIWRLNEDA